LYIAGKIIQNITMPEEYANGKKGLSMDKEEYEMEFQLIAYGKLFRRGSRNLIVASVSFKLIVLFAQYY
jgi:hypothetical protein